MPKQIGFHNNYFLWYKMIEADEPRKLMAGIYIEYPKTDLFVGPHPQKRNNPRFFNIKHDLPYILPKLIIFFAPQFE